MLAHGASRGVRVGRKIFEPRQGRHPRFSCVKGLLPIVLDSRRVVPDVAPHGAYVPRRLRPVPRLARRGLT